MKVSVKKTIIVLLDILLAVYLGFAMTSFNNPDETMKACTNVSIQIDDETTNGFLSAKEIKRILEQKKLYPYKQPMADVNPRSIEDALKSSSFVNTSQCYKTKDGRIVYGGPKCAPRTSPLAQLCAMWETVNNITLTNRDNEKLDITLEQRKQMVEFLCANKELKLTNLYKILGISKKDGWYGGKAIGKGLKGNSTLLQLREALGGKYDQWLEMPVELKDSKWVDTETGEVIKEVTEKIEQTPLFRLWHAVYSLQNADELAKTLREKFQITDKAVIDALFLEH